MLKGGKSTAFRDGVVYIYKDNGAKSDFSALKAPKKLSDMAFIVKLAYKENSRRTQDVEFAEQSGFNLAMKIQTRYVPTVQTKHKAVINGKMYAISYLDKSINDMFLYLEYEREVSADVEGN